MEFSTSRLPVTHFGLLSLLASVVCKVNRFQIISECVNYYLWIIFSSTHEAESYFSYFYGNGSRAIKHISSH